MNDCAEDCEHFLLRVQEYLVLSFSFLSNLGGWVTSGLKYTGERLRAARLLLARRTTTACKHPFEPQKLS
jgi:hypothetical protein